MRRIVAMLVILKYIIRTHIEIVAIISSGMGHFPANQQWIIYEK
jgi:hypothetical protein